MDSIGATALNSPLLNNIFIQENSPVLSEKPFFFAIDPPSPIFNKIEEKCQHHLHHETNNDFKQKVEQRKLQGFVGNEYTAEEAMYKQFGPQQIEARAFLEYYWEMKAKCLEAVENKRNKEIEAFRRHPLFSPGWLVPSRRDIRWHLKNEIGNEDTEIVTEKGLNVSKCQSHIPKFKLRKPDGNKNPTLLHKRQVGKALGDSKRKPLARNIGHKVPLAEIRKPVKKNLSSISYMRTTASSDLGNPQRKPAANKIGYKMPFTETRKNS